MLAMSQHCHLDQLIYMCESAIAKLVYSYITIAVYIHFCEQFFA